jgi:outer membrane protein OmpA-like peptidoglycan-associated protein
MRARFFQILVIASSIFSIATYAQVDNRPTSYVGLQVGGGFSNLFVTNPAPMPDFSSQTLLGGGATAGLFYNLQYKHFLFHTGFGVNYTINRNAFAIQDITSGIAEYPTMQYHYTFDNYVANTAYGVGYVPVMLGMNYEKWYFLVGAKLGVLSFANSTRSQSDVTLWATDDDVIDPMHGLYTHEMQTYHIESTKTNFEFAPFNAMLSAEVGVTLNKHVWLNAKERVKYDRAQRYRNARKKKTFKQLSTYRLSLFADYGLSNIIPPYQANNAPFQAQQQGGIATLNATSDVSLHSAFGYEPYRNSALNNLFVGMKFTMQVEIPKKAPKKGSLSLPYIYVYATDDTNDKPIRAARVQIQHESGKPRTDKYTDDKRGRVGRGMMPGTYWIYVSHGSYLPSDTIWFTHRDDYDTVRVALHPKHKFRWSVVDAATERPLSATFTLQATNGEYAVEAATDSTCSIVGMLDDRMPYKLRVSAENYEPYEIDMERVMDDDFVVRLKPINIKTFVLHNMYFATAQTSILPSSELALDMLYNLLEQNPGLTIRIVGHTDEVGSESSNITLSQGRANSIKKAMVKLGIAPERIQTEGKGETDPVVANDSDQHRQMNRRVEIEILSGAEGINIQRYIQ